jgi:hypothetical protein
VNLKRSVTFIATEQEGENSYFSVKKKPLASSASRPKNSNGWKIGLSD